jgi:multiple sugar transport system ATP-binding protein
MATVEYSHVDKIYPDGTRALEDLNLRIEDGEMVALVGPSGCGKSSALRLLAGLDTASSGEIMIGGERVNERSPQHRDIAMVFQNYALYPHMTVRRNLEFPLHMMKLPKLEIAQRVKEIAGLLGLAELLERVPRQLSGGQRQRVAMGRAIVRQPRVFLMDEPLSNLDAKLRVQIRTEIASLQKRLGITTLYVTHDQVEAITLGDRVAILEAGRLQQVATPQTLYDRPANVFVATFVGNPGMNIFPAILRRGEIKLLVTDGVWSFPFEKLLLHKPRLAEYLNCSILGGLRPEAFTLERADDGVEVIVETVESLGHEHLVYFAPETAISGNKQRALVARLPGPMMESFGQRIKLKFELDQLYFFTESGEVID